MNNYYDKLNELIAAGKPFVSVTVVETAGSAPNDAGDKMLVGSEGLIFGTVGGGSVEKQAIDRAKELLASGDPACRSCLASWNLDQDLGMTCGGAVKIFFERHNYCTWNIAVFGSGHVCLALTALLVNLDCRVTCIDPRAEWLEKLPASCSLQKICRDDLPSCLTLLPGGTFVVIMTMGHAMDKPVLLEALKAGRFPYIGVIGSAAKAARMRRDLVDAGLSEELARSFFCPIGLPLGGNHPQEIAISIASQLIQERDRLAATAQRASAFECEKNMLA
jgi:xanthine dehydrogenase accessory factor